jgi:Domain of unknown function (DUF4167)
MRPRKLGSQLTLRWREADSNSQYRREAWSGPRTKKRLEIRAGPSNVPARKSWPPCSKAGATPSDTETRRSDTLSRDNDPTLIKMKGVMGPGQTRRPYRRNPGNNSYRSQQQIPNRSQAFDSNGPNVKIRGNPHQIFERYLALAREASTSGDRVAAENLYQHAEHYFRMMNAASEGRQHRATRPDAPAGVETEMAGEEGSDMAAPVRASPSDRQPYSA